MTHAQYKYYCEYIPKMIDFFKKSGRGEIVRELKKLRFNNYKKTIGYYESDSINKEVIKSYLRLSELTKLKENGGYYERLF
jgi:hypothetical protein